MDRYYACSVNRNNVVECVPLAFHQVILLDKNIVYNVHGDLPVCLDAFFLMRKFSMPVKIVRG